MTLRELESMPFEQRTTATEQLVIAAIIRAREEGAKCIYFDALATDDNTTTLGKLVDWLPASYPATRWCQKTRCTSLAASGSDYCNFHNQPK